MMLEIQIPFRIERFDGVASSRLVRSLGVCLDSDYGKGFRFRLEEVHRLVYLSLKNLDFGAPICDRRPLAPGEVKKILLPDFLTGGQSSLGGEPSPETTKAA